MDSYLLEWCYLLLKWTHVIVAIAWIGASFYFVWLDNHLEKPKSKDVLDRGVDGELWAVHGGGFYNPQKYMVAPKDIPEKLHWFYWESYSTWMSGFALFVTLYVGNAKVYLIDPGKTIQNPGVAILAALACLFVGLLIYDILCRLLEKRSQTLGICVAVLVGCVAFIACQLFPGRSAFIIIGATMATMMSANVFIWIIPGQRKVLAAMKQGDPVDPIHGKRGKQRSVHNTYLTLPVIFCMLSNHFSLIAMHDLNWLALILMMAAGVSVRQYFVLRHKGLQKMRYPALSLFFIGIVFFLVKPPAINSQPLNRKVTIQEVQNIIKIRCTPCHSATPTLLTEAPKGVAFDTIEDIENFRPDFYIQVVQTKIMPLGNVTKMTPEERATIARWLKQSP